MNHKPEGSKFSWLGKRSGSEVRVRGPKVSADQGENFLFLMFKRHHTANDVTMLCHFLRIYFLKKH